MKKFFDEEMPSLNFLGHFSTKNLHFQLKNEHFSKKISPAALFLLYYNQFVVWRPFFGRKGTPHRTLPPPHLAHVCSGTSDLTPKC
jgi:hypothetical protein